MERWYFAQVPARLEAEAAKAKADELTEAALSPSLAEMAENPCC